MRYEVGSMKYENGGRRFLSYFLLLASYFVLFAFCFLLLSACARKGMSTVAVSSPQQSYHGDNYKIGVILPLTGKYAAYGNATLNGIECAAGIFSPCEGPVNAELVIKDDGGEPEKAALAVEELARNEGASVIIGPMTSSSVNAAALKAQEIGVPLISLSQKEDVADTGNYIFGVALTAEAQVKAIVDWARHTKKIKNFAIVYPMNAYGKKYKDLFDAHVTESKGKVVFAKEYGETTLDFGGMFRTNIPKFEALFIPDSYRAVGYIAPVLEMEGVKGVQLIGVSRWNNPELVERGGDALQGAVFVDGFFDKSNSTAVHKFVDMFSQAYQINPTILEAQSFDAARIAMKALASTGGAHAKDVRDFMANLPDVIGATGGIGFDANREVIRKIFLLTVKKDEIVELEN